MSKDNENTVLESNGLEFTNLGDIFTNLVEDIETGEKTTIVNAAVTLAYNGVVSKEVVGDLLETALEHCRQEGMLSDPDWANDSETEELGCDAIRCRIV